MRIILLSFVIIIGANIGVNLIHEVLKIQDSKMAQFCKVDPSYCANQKGGTQ
tara:strand:- start:5941 stop:6096 length:156 start_codon:yes stop_codon:yes gene_type:complete